MSAILLPRTPRGQSLGSVFSAMIGGGHRSRTPRCCSPPQAWVWGLSTSCVDIRGKPWVLPQRALSQVSPYEDRGDMEAESTCPCVPCPHAHSGFNWTLGPCFCSVNTRNWREGGHSRHTGKEGAGRGALPCQEHQTTSSLLEGRPPMHKGPQEKVEGAGQWG